MNLFEETLDRRRVLAGTLGAGLAATVGLGLARAQDEAATPAAGVGAPQDDETEEDAAAIERVTESISSAQADRDAVAAQIDPVTVDQLLARATDLRDRAQAAADGRDADEARRLARAAAATARAASELVEAQLIVAGLPSQEAPASRILAESHEAIQTAIDETSGATDEDRAFFISTAQALYQSAFDLYGAAAYGQAARTAGVAAGLTRIAQFLMAPTDEDGFGGDRGRVRRGDGPGDRDPDSESDQPVPVPEPTF